MRRQKKRKKKGEKKINNNVSKKQHSTTTTFTTTTTKREDDGENGLFVFVVFVFSDDDREETQGRRVRRSRFDGDGVWCRRDCFRFVGRVVGVVEPTGRREIVYVVLGKKNTRRVLFGG